MEKKLSISTKITYGMGDLASQLFWSFTSSYLLIFYSDIVGLSAGAISIILLAARIWDGINDPILGALAERTKSKHGRFRPYILYGTPFLALFSVLTFTAPGFGGNIGAKIAWAAVTYIGLGMLYTAVNLPYGSLATVMTKDLEERNTLVSFRQIGSNIGGVVLSAISLPLITFFSGSGEINARGYTLTALVFALIATPIFYLLFAKCKEVVQPVNKGVKVPIKASIKAVLNRPMICIIFINFFILLGLFGRIGVVLYYFLYVIQKPALVALLMPAPFIVGAIAIFLFSRFTKYIGKKKMLYIGFIIGAIALIGIYFTDYSNLTGLILFTILYGVAFIANPIGMALIPEAIDYAEDKTGVRADGIAYATFSLATKFASAISGSVGILLLAKAGYVANAVQSAETMQGINMVVNILPAICYLLAFIPTFFYNITDKMAGEIRESLDRKEKAAIGAE